MRILFTIPHYFDWRKRRTPGRHGSLGRDPRPRIRALTACIRALHELFCTGQCVIDIGKKAPLPVNQSSACHVDVVVCTTRNAHILDEVPVPDYYQHHATEAEPPLLGFECHAVLREWLGQYDYYCYLEDDLVLHDPWLFHKLAWFNKSAGDDKLLQPNRYEVGLHPSVHKAYVDGDLAEHVTARFENPPPSPLRKGGHRRGSTLKRTVMGTRVIFERALNPHSGCFFLNARQMQRWAGRPYFLDRDASFIGPLESAATLGIMKTFQVYKPAPANASFLEIEHCDRRFLGLIRQKKEEAVNGRERGERGEETAEANAALLKIAD